MNGFDCAESTENIMVGRISSVLQSTLLIKKYLIFRLVILIVII